MHGTIDDPAKTKANETVKEEKEADSAPKEKKSKLPEGIVGPYTNWYITLPVFIFLGSMQIHVKSQTFFFLMQNFS